MSKEGFQRLAKVVARHIPQFAGITGSYYCQTPCTYAEKCSLYEDYTCDPAGISCSSGYECQVEISCAYIFKCYEDPYTCHTEVDFNCNHQVMCTYIFNCSSCDNHFDCVEFNCDEAWNLCDPITKYDCNPSSAYNSSC